MGETIASATAFLSDDILHFKYGAREQVKNIIRSQSLLSEWNLFLEVPRWNKDGSLKSFNFIENLSLLKGDHSVYYDGLQHSNLWDQDFHVFVQQGRGIIPFDYWTNNGDQLIACISGALGRSYIAEECMRLQKHGIIEKELKVEKRFL